MKKTVTNATQAAGDAAAENPASAAGPRSTRAANKAQGRGSTRAPRSPSVKPMGKVDLTKDCSLRPMAGRDIITYMEEYQLERVQVVESLALASPGAFSRVINDSDTQLPHEMELLLRLYMRQTKRPRKLLPIDVFNTIYGPLLAQFEGEAENSARIMLYERFSSMLGHTVYSAYRWFKMDNSFNYGKANGQLRRLFAQLPEDPDEMRSTLEDLAREVYRVRGRNLDAEFPLPDPANPPAPRRPGPAPGHRARRDRALMDAVSDAVISSAKARASGAEAAPEAPSRRKPPRSAKVAPLPAAPATAA